MQPQRSKSVPSETRTCEQCGSVFRVAVSVLRQGHSGRFCNRECRKAYHHTPASLWNRVSREVGECWPWLDGKNPAGYGVIRYAEDTWLTHRLAYTLAFGTIPAGFAVCHRCDNPPCCRPDHLFLGTLAENNADMQTKGRNDQWGHKASPRRGATHPMAKLTSEQVGEIRALAAKCEMQKRLALRFGVGRDTIRRILRGLSWNNS